MEVITCVSTAEALKAAVTAGADGVRIGLRGFSARGLSMEELKKAARYCRVRGVYLAVRMDAPVSPDRFSEACDVAGALAKSGVNAITVGDAGFLHALRLMLPGMKLETAENLPVTDAMGAKLLQAVGADRILLPAMLEREEIRHLCKKSGMEIEVTVCADSPCPAVGVCRMSAFAGSGQSLLCGKECREHFLCQGVNGEMRPALKGVLLPEALKELREMGVRAVNLQCGEGKADYASMASDIFARALRDGKNPPARDIEILSRSFLKDGASDALYRGAPSEALLGNKTEWKWPNLGKNIGKGPARAELAGGEFQRVEVTFRAEVRQGTFSRIAVSDGEGHTAGATGPIPSKAGSGKRELNTAILRTNLFNTLGTPFLCTDVTASVEPGLHLSSADLGQMRREALNRLSDLRAEAPEVNTEPLPSLVRDAGQTAPPDITISVQQTAQLSEALAALRPKVLYVPIEALLRQPQAVTPFWENGVTAVCAVLPGRCSAAEAPALYAKLKDLRALQVEEVMAESFNAVMPAKLMGFRVRCGLGLEAWNDWGLRACKELGAESAILSPELSLAQIRSISKRMDTELYAYGRLPLMTSEAAMTAPGASADTLRDRKGRQYPVLNTLGRSVLYSPDKLFVGDKLKDLQELGVWCLHLGFTTENAAECVSVTERYLGLNAYLPNFRTKGHYYENETNAGLRLPKKAGAAGNAGRL